MLEKVQKYRRKAGVAELDTTPKSQVHNQQIYYYHTDHLGTPQELTDQDGHIVWSAQYQAWGRIHHIERPAKLVTVQQGNTLTQSLVAVEQIEQPLRFQGQYHDNETGLHYNRYRYYDPDIGRFISQDPIGLLGGMNLYQYAPNPVGWVDPWGLCSKVLGDNLEKAGQNRPKDTAAHHVVGDTSKAAQPARDVLKKHGIDVDDAVNGVFLPNRNNTDKALSGILHNGRHPNAYIEKVNVLIKRANELGGKPAVIDKLGEIKNVLSTAPRDASWSMILGKL